MTRRTKGLPDIHEHPTFRALVDDLREQSPEQIDRFQNFLKGELDAETGPDETPNLLPLVETTLRGVHDLPKGKQQALLESLEGKSPAEFLQIVSEVCGHDE